MADETTHQADDKLQKEIKKMKEEIEEWEERDKTPEYNKQIQVMQELEDEMDHEYEKIIAEMENVVKAKEIVDEEHKKILDKINSEEEEKIKKENTTHEERIANIKNKEKEESEKIRHKNELEKINNNANKEKEKENIENEKKLKEIYEKAIELNKKEIDKAKKLKKEANDLKKELNDPKREKSSREPEIKKIQDEVKKFKLERRRQWDEYYMKIACLAALRSKDPRTPVGACIVDRENGQIVGIGYNSMPKDKDFTWKGAGSQILKKSINPGFKYAYVVHAAINAILNKTRESIKGCILYTTLHPDEDCAHAMIQAGMKEVVYCMYTRKVDLDPDQKKAQVIFEIKKIQYRELPNDDLKDDKYVKELQLRIEQGKKLGDKADREPEPATAIPLEKFFMRMAKLSQKRPGDFQNKAVGACIATPNKQIVAVEYSGEPEGIELDIKRKAKKLHPGLHMSNDSSFFVHAEYRAIVGRSVRGCTLYVTSYPCNVCAKMIVESGIKEVVYYKDGYWNDDRYKSSRKILTTCLDPSNIRKYGNGGSRNESQDEASRSIAIEEPGHTYIGKITIVLQYIIIILVLVLLLVASFVLLITSISISINSY